ncbi:hypothetical protein PTSG_03167 [Salpingoeca rosetta]|uniref:N-alpha-acetyltransferase 40 n=1 Tax=Salpingoeca rosetta (strain ATCC 50818 / BSB-021) TaxID=946362 RepID=F2U4F1_SALR5|nr:uncharacterized protein PTSG_03167 [Salpingoeca rosetta]EGD82517.1 hypothetical protein PTSG_03167 [Salpingoeca rosetta]|eukprot:XP_004995753.1 hypothetical protein PTSG_03167 [Salpingoeca rosetta]
MAEAEKKKLFDTEQDHSPLFVNEVQRYMQQRCMQQQQQQRYVEQAAREEGDKRNAGSALDGGRAERDALEARCWTHDKVLQSPYLSDIWTMLDRMRPAYDKHGWDWSEKEDELFAEGMHFILLLQQQQLIGFTIFLLDEEDEQWVVYCYELHVAEGHKGKGLGKFLVECLEHVARHIGMVGIALTCFKDNDALRFYERTGFSIADHSPSKHNDPDAPYEILMKRI